jgi:tight adherence protein B
VNAYVPMAAALFALCVFVYLPDPPAVRLARRLGRSATPSRTRSPKPPARRPNAHPRARRAREAGARKAVCEACEVMAAELRAGRTPGQALDAGAALFPGLLPATAAAAFGGDVPEALRAYHGPGEEALRPLSAAWLVAERSGAGLAALLDRTVASLREAEALRDEVGAQLAGPRATSRVLAALPLVGVALGFGMDADPIGLLLGTPVGVACLLAGATLAGAGLYWVERLARSAEDAR